MLVTLLSLQDYWRAHTYVYVYVCICMYVYVRTYMNTGANLRQIGHESCSHTHSYIHIYTYAYIPANG